MSLSGRLAAEDADRLIETTASALSDLTDVLRKGADSEVPSSSAVAAVGNEETTPPFGLLSTDLETWRTVLIDLGYLDPNLGDLGSHVIEDALGVAFEEFCKELLQTPEFQRFHDTLLSRGQANEAATPASFVAQDALLESLSDFLSLDTGDTAPDRIPRIGEVSVWSRIVQARLDRLGIFSGNAGDPYGQTTEEALKGLLRCIAVQPILGAVLPVQPFMITRSGRADELLRFLECPEPESGWYEFAVYEAPADHRPQEASFSSLSVNSNGKFVDRGVSRDVRFNDRAFRDRVSLSQRCNSARNKLSLRLVQIKLWQAGFYTGRLDTAYGPRTLDALLGAIEHFGFQRESVILSFGRGYFALNLRFLSQKLFPNFLSDADPDANEGIIKETVQAIEDVRQISSQPAPPQPSVEERSRGWRLNFRPIGRLFRRVVSAVARGVRAGVDSVRNAIVQPIADAVRLAVDSARRAVQAIAVSARQFLQFVLGLPVSTPRENEGEPKIVSVFQLDRDCVSIVGDDATAADHRLHRDRISRLTASLEFAFTVIGTAAFIARNLAVGPLGWVSIALRLGRTLIRLIRRWRDQPTSQLATI